MEFGVAFPSKIGDFKLVELAESLGFDQAWFFDSQMIYSDVYATMALAAHKTKKIKLATGVAVPSTRLAPVIAHSIATIATLAPNRVELGLGNGNTARLTMGLPPLKLDTLKKEIETIKLLLEGKEATHFYEGREIPIKLLHPSSGFINLKDKIPITLSAFGPKTLRYCGQSCDAHLTWAISPDQLKSNREIIESASMTEGKGKNEVPTKGIFPLCLLEPGENIQSKRVLEAVGPFVTNLLHVLCEWEDNLLPASPEINSLVSDYREFTKSFPLNKRHQILHEGHLIYVRPDEKEFVTPEIAKEAAMIGEPEEIMDRLRILEKNGLSHFAFQITCEPEKQIKTFAKEIIKKY